MTTHTPFTAQPPVSVREIALKYGGMAFGMMLIYFFIVNALGFQEFEAARFGSNAFAALAVFFAIRTYKKQTSGPAPYLNGLSLGFLVGLVSSVLFAAFIFLYANLINAGYYAELREQTYFHVSLNPFMLAMTIALLGVVIGSLTGYILMMSDGTNGTGSSGESTGN